MPRARFVPLCVAMLAVLGLGSSPAFAATWTWDGSEGNDNWTNTPNWTPASAVANDGTADIIFGAPIVQTTPDMNGNWSVNSVTFNNTAIAFTLYSSTASTLTVGAGGINNYDADSQSISHAITLSAAQTWNAAAGPLTTNGAVNNGGNLLTIDAASAIGTSVIISDALSGSGGLTKNGQGTLQLVQIGGPNTYTGTTTVNAGRLEISGASGVVAIPGSLEIGDGVGTAIDTVINSLSNKIADSATVSVFSTGAWLLTNSSFTVSEAIENLNIVSTGIAGGGLVTIRDGTLTILGNMTMTGGTVTTFSTGTLLLNGPLTTNPTGITASISSKLDLNGRAHTFNILDGAAQNDLDVTGVVSNGMITKDGLGALRLGASNTYAGGTVLNAGTIFIGHDSALGTGSVTGQGGTLRADGAERTIVNAVNGSFAVDGAFALTLNSPLNLNGNITKNGSGTLIFAQSAIFDALTVNVGIVRIDAPVIFTAGLTNSATLLIGTQTLTVNGAGINNQGSLPLAGGTLAGSGSVVNNGLISGYGTIGGSGGFTNNAQLTVSDGSLTIANAGANANAGNLDVPAGLQLRLIGGNLANTGTMNLNGGVVTGTATLNNNPGGVISGHGIISSPFGNNAGSLAVDSGTLRMPQGIFSNGEILLGGGLSTLSGTGAITNTGLIRGDGVVSKAVNNNTGGEIRGEAGKRLRLDGPNGPNLGNLNLHGGTLEFKQPLTNAAAGNINGRGTLVFGIGSATGLTNDGNVGFSAGFTDVYGDVVNSAMGKIVISGGGVLTFYDDLINAGEIRTASGGRTVTYGALSGSGSFPGTGTVQIEGDLTPGSSPGSVRFEGDLLLGRTARTELELAGTVPGAQYDQLHVGGLLSLNGALDVTLLDGFAPRYGDTFDLLDFGSLAGRFDNMNLPALDAGLAWDTSALYSTGTITAVPEPSTWLLSALAALTTVAHVRRRRILCR